MIAKADRPLKTPLSRGPRGPSLVNVGPCRKTRATCQLSFDSKQLCSLQSRNERWIGRWIGDEYPQVRFHGYTGYSGYFVAAY